MRTICLSLFLILSCQPILAQVENDLHILEQIGDTTAAEVPVLTPYDKLIIDMGSSLHIPDSIGTAIKKHIEKNKSRKSNSYRIRIYFDNSQDARNVSEQIADTFKVHYPDIPVYRIYANPYFKVTVGDFRSKSDAMRFLEAIRPKYPTVFLVREAFSTI